VARINLGSLLYLAKTKDGEMTEYQYPFNGDGRLKPSFGFELGKNDLYVFFRSLSSLPLYSGGDNWEIGLGTRAAGLYEHKFYFSASPFNFASLGYRGEYKLVNATSLTFGVRLGGRDYVNLYSMLVGIRTAL